jgi:diguanylate cyclase (GGDEF)-like protein
MNGPLALSATMTAILSIGAVQQWAALAAARAASLVVLGLTASMLLRPRMRSLRGAARATAFMIFGVMAVLGLRLLLGLGLLSSRYAGLDALGHDATMVTVTALGFSFVGMYVAETKRRLHEETRLDSLTGLHNRRAFEEMAHREVQVAARESTPLTLLMMDLDHFKQLNDTWGHALGDRALRAFGGVLLTVTGSCDAVARLGGEEFAILLPGRSARSALALAERLRATVEGLRLAEGEELVRFTVSVGLSSLRAGEQGLEAMFHRADRALYQAKREGRNRVMLADSLPGPIPPSRATVSELHPVRPVTAMAANSSPRPWPTEYARTRHQL